MKRLFVQCLVIITVVVAWPQNVERDASFTKRMFTGIQQPAESTIFEKTEKTYPTSAFKSILFQSEPKASVTEEIIFPGKVLRVLPIDLQFEQQKENKKIVFKSQEKTNAIRYNTQKDTNTYYLGNVDQDKQYTKIHQQIYSKAHRHYNTDANKHGFVKFEQSNEPTIVWTGNVRAPYAAENMKPILPWCFKKRTDDVTMLDTNAQLLPNHEKFIYPPVLLNRLYGIYSYPQIFLPIYHDVSRNDGSFNYVPLNNFVGHSSSTSSYLHHLQSYYNHNSKFDIKTNNNHIVNRGPNFVASNKIDESHTLGPMPSQYLPEHEPSNKVSTGNTQSLQENVATKENFPFVFKNFHQNDDGGRTEQVQQQKDETIKTHNVNSNYNYNNMQQTYYYVPPVIKTTTDIKVNHKENSYKLDTFNISSDQTESVANTTVTQDITNNNSNKTVQDLFKDHPIAVLDIETVTDLQTDDIGTSVPDEGKKDLKVDIKTNEDQNKHRGDIPDE